LSFSKRVKLSIAAACILLLVLFSLLLWPTPPILKLTFIGFTNEPSNRMAIFQISNQTDQPVSYWLTVETKLSTGWPAYTPSTVPHLVRNSVGPAQSLPILVKPQAVGTTWRLFVTYPQSDSKLGELISDVRSLLYDANMTRAGDKLATQKSGHTLVSQEIHE